VSGALLFVCLTMAPSSLQMTTVAHGTLSAVERPREAVVRTQEEWAALWREHTPEGEAPAVDFSTRTVVAVFLGTRPTAGYDVTISSVERDGARVVVRYRAIRPNRDMMTAQVLTSPFSIVSVPRFDEDARFERVDAESPR
jgi:hypothetical protein